MRFGKRIRFVLIIGVVITSLILWLVYFPEHWLRRVDLGTVKVDDRTVKADFYIGEPTHREAESIALIHVPGIGDYFFDFGNENYREAASSEFISMKIGVWTLRSMRTGRFIPPLPSNKMNEIRIASSNGHIVIVQL